MGASSFIASSTQVTLGKVSYSTRILRRRFFREIRVGRRHGRDRVALVKDLAHGQAIRGHVRQVHGASLAHDLAAICPGLGKSAEVTTAKTPGIFNASLGVDRLDPGMSVRAADDLAVGHARQMDVGRVNRLAGHLVGPVVPHGAVAKHLVTRLSEIDFAACQTWETPRCVIS